jgi:hypothetical protein
MCLQQCPVPPVILGGSRQLGRPITDELLAYSAPNGANMHVEATQSSLSLTAEIDGSWRS